MGKIGSVTFPITMAADARLLPLLDQSVVFGDDGADVWSALELYDFKMMKQVHSSRGDVDLFLGSDVGGDQLLLRGDVRIALRSWGIMQEHLSALSAAALVWGDYAASFGALTRAVPLQILCGQPGRAEALLGALRLFPYGSEASVAHADALWRRLEQTVVWGEVAQGDADGGGGGGGSNRLQSPDFEDFNEDASEMGASKKKRGKKSGKEWAKAHCSQGMQAADGSAPGRSEQERWCASKAAAASAPGKKPAAKAAAAKTAAATAAPGAPGYLTRSTFLFVVRALCKLASPGDADPDDDIDWIPSDEATLRAMAAERAFEPGRTSPALLAAQLHERAGRVDAAARAAAVAIDAAASNPVVRGVARLVRGRCLHALGQNSDCFALLLNIEEEEGKALPFLAGCASREAARLAPNELVGQGARERFTALVNALPAANPQELVPLLGADLAAQAHNELVAHVLEASSSPAFARPSSGKKGAAARRRPGGD